MPVMAQARRKRDNAAQYFDVGVQGRRTGITLPQNPRDSLGIENIDGVFSSPEKSPRQETRTVVVADSSDRTLGSTDMDVASDLTTDKIPTEVLIDRQVLRSTKSTFPPPSSRSPIKTNLGSSPRRLSAAAIRSAAKPIATVKSVARRLDFQAEKPRQTLEPSKALEVRNRKSPKSKAKTAEVTRLATPEEVETHGNGEQDEEELVQTGLEAPTESDLLPAVESMVDFVDGDYAGADDDDDYAPIVIDDASPPPVIIVESEHEEDAQPASPQSSAKRKRGRSAKSPKARQPSEEIIPSPRMSPPPPVSRSPKVDKPTWRPPAGKRPPGSAAITNGFQYQAMPPPPPPPKDKKQTNSKKEKVSQKSSTEAEPKKRGRGRPRKADKLAKEVADLNAHSSLIPPTAVFQKHRSKPRQPTEELDADGESDYDEDDVYQPDPRKLKKSKHSHHHSQQSQSHVLADKDPNSRMRSTSPGKSLWSQAASRRPLARTLQILHGSTPWEENPTVTRSGRRSVRPLEYWANEKVELDPYGTIVNVVRAQSVEVEKKARKPRVARSRRAPDGLDMGTLQEEEELEDWEENGEVQQGAVALLNPETGEIDGEEDRQLSWGIHSIQTRDVDNANFKFGKYFNLPFMSTGIMEFPVNGFKQVKHSGRMHLVFFVQYGKLEVTVHESVFTVSTGGVWQVPNGNTYGIQNIAEQPARVFFAQGCPVDAD